ncbi:hypothetical protein QUB27_18625 [Microcoleus sp. AT8-B6]|uniref:hypothetical protein n=1 Tax=Microcoleus sp. AT8-B6 TaxID=2818622 RepID=UPI002FCFA54D
MLIPPCESDSGSPTAPTCHRSNNPIAPTVPLDRASLSNRASRACGAIITPSAVPAIQSPQNPTHRPKCCIFHPCQCQPSDRLSPGHSRSPRSHPIALLNLAI